jgi:uracil-DNA glycosylase family 4
LITAQDNIELRLLEWYAAMGVDEAVGEEPCDWFGLSHAVVAAPAPALASAPGKRSPPSRPALAMAAPPSAAPPRQPSGAARRPPAPVNAAAAAPDQAVMAAREEARRASTLEELEAALARFDGCPLKKTAKNMCFARGNPKARLMIVGEAPGRDEDVAGKPFVGRAGRLLDKMLAAIGLNEDQVYITNVVYWRPPGNRTPTPQEAQTCQPFLERQIQIVAPDILLFAGGAAAKQFLKTTEGILRLRGKWRTYNAGDRQIRCMATLHPAYLLRNPASKRLAWRDLLAVRAALDEIPS